MKAANDLVGKEDKNNRLSSLQNLPKQEDLVRKFTPMAASIWSAADTSLPPDDFKFTLNAAVDVTST